MDLFRFGEYEFDATVPELHRDGSPVPMQVVPLRVLELLLQEPGRLVTRDEFFAALWPDDRSGLLDDNLNTAVRKLRIALADAASRPEFIETVPKRGYRFIAPVSVAGREAGAAAPSAPGDSPVTRAARRPGAKVALLALAVVAAGFAMSGMILKGGGGEDFSRAGDSVATGTTVAVMPFINATGDASRDYFSDGLTEEIMDSLSREDVLRIVSRSSAFAARNASLGARELGAHLGADALVEGSVRGDDESLRVSARLVDTHTGLQLWSRTYARPMNESALVQQEIADAVTEALTGSTASPPVHREAIGAVAYDQYLRGRYAWHRRSRVGLLAAVEHFSQATELAPRYARAWAGLADAYAVLGFYDFLEPAEAFPLAREAALRALELDPANADAEANLGYVALYYDWDLDAAERHFLHSIEMQPDSSKAHQWYANLLTAAGRFEEAEREMRRAQQLEPLSLIASAALGWVRFFGGDYDAALEQLSLTLELDPNFELAYLWSGWSQEALGRLDEAVATLRQAVIRSGSSNISMASLARAHALRGETRLAREQLAGLEASGDYLPSYEIAKAWFALDEPETALRWLERALAERSHSLVFLRVDPQMRSALEIPAVAAFVDRALSAAASN